MCCYYREHLHDMYGAPLSTSRGEDVEDSGRPTRNHKMDMIFRVLVSVCVGLTKTSEDDRMSVHDAYVALYSLQQALRKANVDEFEQRNMIRARAAPVVTVPHHVPTTRTRGGDDFVVALTCAWMYDVLKMDIKRAPFHVFPV